MKPCFPVHGPYSCSCSYHELRESAKDAKETNPNYLDFYSIKTAKKE